MTGEAYDYEHHRAHIFQARRGGRVCLARVTRAHLPGLHHQFDSFEQQRESATLGMWVFLVQEVMFFGGLFAAYVVYRAAVSRGPSPPAATTWTSGSAPSTPWC